MLKFALFDLDDTLYAAQCGLWTAIGARIDMYMVERLGYAPGTTSARRKHYLESFGTTLNGLRREHDLDPNEFLQYVHAVPVNDYLVTSAELDQMLARLPLTKLIFTNADAAHARRVLSCLGVAKQFSRIIDIHALEYANKPQPAAYARALALAGAQPAECVFIDDQLRNLRPAYALGMVTVLIRPEGGPLPEGVHLQLESVLGLEAALAPWLEPAGEGTRP